MAVKILHPHLLEEPGYFRRFLREAQIGHRVVHENVVRTYDCDAVRLDGEDHHYLVMEYVRGQTLGDLLEELERLPEQLCRHVAKEVAKALRAIHEAGAVHRDLKPDNVLITEDQKIKVMDLGVARLQGDALRLTRVGTFVGSIHYACPEQFRRDAPDLDGRADLHALGVMLYELGTGQHPYRHDDINVVLRRIVDEVPRRAGSINPQLSPFFEEVVHTLMEKDPDERFPSAHGLLDALVDGEASNWWTGRARALRLETHRPLRRVHVPRDTELYGREPELERLEAAWAQARAGRGQVMLISGEAGSGKTRLIDEFAGRLEAEGEQLNFLVGAYPPGGAATTAGAFSTAYREQFGPEGLEETLERYLAETPLLIPAFAALLRGEPAPEGTAPLSKDSMQTTFVHATRTLAVERPTLILIDDLHFAPEEGRALFASLSLAVPGHRILLVGTMRPGVPESWTANVERPEHAARIELQRLGPKDLVHLMEDAFHSQRLAEVLGVMIAVKSDGNPFFVFEIIRGLREDGSIAKRPDGTWVSTRVIENVQVPSSIEDLIHARIADLDDVEKHLLEVAACCGFQFDGSIVAQAVDAARIPTFRSLGHLEQGHQLVRSVGRRFVFDHHQIQETLYEGLPLVLREEYHGAIADALEHQAAEEKGTDAPVSGALAVDLCDHFLRARRGRRALVHLDAAVEHLLSGYQNDQATALLRRTLDVPGLLESVPRAEYLVRLSDRLHILGKRKEQEAAAREAYALAKEADLPILTARALSCLSAGLCATARFGEARERLEEARDLARAAGDRWEELRATGNIGVVLLDSGRHEEAQQHFTEVLREARAAGEKHAEMRALGNLGNALYACLRFDEAGERFKEQMALAREREDVGNEASAAGGLGRQHIHDGRFEEARAKFELERTLYASMGNRRGEAVAHGNLAYSFRCLGLYDELRSHAERYLAIALEIGDLWSQCRAYDLRSTIALELGRITEARAVAESWRDLARELKDAPQEVRALRMLGMVADASGDPAGALKCFDASLTQRKVRGDRFGESGDLSDRARVRHSTGDLQGAVEDLDAALFYVRTADAPTIRLKAEARRATLPKGDAQAALDALEACEARTPLPERIEPRWLLWQATGDRAHLAEAHRLLTFLREHAPEEARTSLIENLRAHRAIEAAWTDPSA